MSAPPGSVRRVRPLAEPFGRAPEAGHFIPRVRCGTDAVENLVLADRACNNDKRDLLPAPPLVGAWADRNRDHQGTLASLASVCGWDSDPDGTLAVARTIYRTCHWAWRRSGAAPGTWTSLTPAPASS